MLASAAATAAGFLAWGGWKEYQRSEAPKEIRRKILLQTEAASIIANLTDPWIGLTPSFRRSILALDSTCIAVLRMHGPEALRDSLTFQLEHSSQQARLLVIDWATKRGYPICADLVFQAMTWVTPKERRSISRHMARHPSALVTQEENGETLDTLIAGETDSSIAADLADLRNWLFT